MIRTLNVCKECPEFKTYDHKLGLKVYKCDKDNALGYYTIEMYIQRSLDDCKFQLEHLILKQKGD